jgi:hypothetical protein
VNSLHCKFTNSEVPIEKRGLVPWPTGRVEKELVEGARKPQASGHRGSGIYKTRFRERRTRDIARSDFLI